jgi:hypothetical protein
VKWRGAIGGTSGWGWGKLGRGSPPRGSGTICLVIFKLVASGWGRDASPLGGCYVLSLGVVSFAAPGVPWAVLCVGFDPVEGLRSCFGGCW